MTTLYNPDPPRLSLEVLHLPPETNCSYVVRADWPTRENDQLCSRKALAVCMSEGCEAALCAVHMEFCSKCLKEFCDGCLAVHECL